MREDDTAEPEPPADGDDEHEGPEAEREGSDPVTGSTPTDPAVDRTGPPPDGEDPMAGPAPTG